jgi:hypothetical protein
MATLLAAAEIALEGDAVRFSSEFHVACMIMALRDETRRMGSPD